MITYLEVRALASSNGTGSLDRAAGVLLAERGRELSSLLVAHRDGNCSIDFANINSAVQVGEARELEAVLARPVNYRGKLAIVSKNLKK